MGHLSYKTHKLLEFSKLVVREIKDRTHEFPNIWRSLIDTLELFSSIILVFLRDKEVEPICKGSCINLSNFTLSLSKDFPFFD